MVIASNGNTVWLCLVKSVSLMCPLYQDNVPDIAQIGGSGGPQPLASWSHCECGQ